MKKEDRVFNISQLKMDNIKRQLRGCKAYLKGPAVNAVNTFILWSYAKPVAIMEFNPVTEVVTKAYFTHDTKPTRTQYAHIRKACALFRNGTQLYSFYKECVKSGKFSVYVK